jgi:polypyrimidine tract-binding protein 2
MSVAQLIKRILNAVHSVKQSMLSKHPFTVFFTITFFVLVLIRIFFLHIQAHDERSRDYTISDPNAQLQAAAQAPAVTAPAAAWQNTAPAAPFYPSTAAATPVGQVPAWNPNMQPGAFATASTAYTSRPLMANSMPRYPAIGSSSGAPPAFQASQQMAQYGIPLAGPRHAPPAGQPMYFPK